MQDMTQAGLFAPPGLDMQPVPRRALTMWRLISALGWILFSGVVGVTLGVVTPTVWNWSAWWGCTAALVVPLAVLRWRRLGIAWRLAGWCLTDDDMVIRDGVVYRSLKYVNYGRIQGVEVSSGPMQRRFSLASVVVRTGAPHGVVVNDVDQQVAEDLRDRLVALARERGVEL